MIGPLTIRLAEDRDLADLVRLAERDTRPLPSGKLLVAEREGIIDAALSLDSGEVVADPFKRTADLVDLLRAHAEARDARPPRSIRRRRLVPRLVGGSA